MHVDAALSKDLATIAMVAWDNKVISWKHGPRKFQQGTNCGRSNNNLMGSTINKVVNLKRLIVEGAAKVCIDALNGDSVDVCL